MVKANNRSGDKKRRPLDFLPGSLLEEETRERWAKACVFDKLLNRLAGIGTGALLGAFFWCSWDVCISYHSFTVCTNVKQHTTFGAISASAVGTSAATGGVMGAVKWYHVAEWEDTLRKAAKHTAEAVKNEAQSVCSKAKDRMSEAKKITLTLY